WCNPPRIGCATISPNPLDCTRGWRVLPKRNVWFIPARAGNAHFEMVRGPPSKVVSWRNELVTRTEKGKDGEPVMVVMPRVTIVDADKISDEAAAAVAEVWQTANEALRVKPT